MYEEINQLVEKALEKDQKARLKLIESLKPMILSRIRRIHPYTDMKEDLVQEAIILLLECLDSFNKEKKVPFVHYYHMQLQYYLWDQAKKLQKSELCLLDQPDPSGQCLVDQLQSQENIEDSLFMEEESQDLEKIILLLPQREAQVIQLHYYNNLSLGEIAAYLKLSYQTIANTKTRALKKIRRTYAAKQEINSL